MNKPDQVPPASCSRSTSLTTIAEEFIYIPTRKKDIMESKSKHSDILKNWTSDAQCKLLYLRRCQTERLTGPEAIRKCLAEYNLSDTSDTCEVIFLVRASGITITEVVSRHFFRRCLPIETISFCGLDKTTKNMFGVVVREKDKNWCHLFAQLEEHQPAKAIVKFINEQFALKSHP